MDHPAAPPIIAMIMLGVASLVAARAVVALLAQAEQPPADPAASLKWDVLADAEQITRAAAGRHGLE